MKVEIISVDPHNSTQVCVWVRLPDYDIFTEVVTGYTLTISEGVASYDLLKALEADAYHLSQVTELELQDTRIDASLLRIKAAIAELKKEET